MDYIEPIYRPPSEGKSLLIQVTLGCSWPKCTFCASSLIKYIKPFKIRTYDEIKLHINKLREYYRNIPIRRAFLLDSNALVIKTKNLLKILNYINKIFPKIERISTYGTIQDIKRKSNDELISLKNAGLKLIYVGIESGDNEILKIINKGVKSQDAILESQRLIESGIKLSATIILGLGGKKHSYNHIINTAKVMNAINPHYIGALTLMVIPNTPLHQRLQKKEFILLNSTEMLQELRFLIENLTKLKNVIFRSNHASNYLALKGILSRDRDKLLKQIDTCITSGNIRPDFLRGL